MPPKHSSEKPVKYVVAGRKENYSGQKASAKSSKPSIAPPSQSGLPQARSGPKK